MSIIKTIFEGLTNAIARENKWKHHEILEQIYLGKMVTGRPTKENNEHLYDYEIPQKSVSGLCTFITGNNLVGITFGESSMLYFSESEIEELK